MSMLGLVVITAAVVLFSLSLYNDNKEMKHAKNEAEAFFEEVKHSNERATRLSKANKDLRVKVTKLESNVDKLADELKVALAERDEAREVAEKFREKYLGLKMKEEIRLQRADVYIKMYENSKQYKYQEED